MNKEQYKQLLSLRKSEEEMFWHLIRVTGKKPRELIENLPIHHKRAWYLLEKWSRQGKYNWGTALDLGWVEYRYEDGKKRDLWQMKTLTIPTSSEIADFKKQWKQISVDVGMMPCIVPYTIE